MEIKVSTIYFLETCVTKIGDSWQINEGREKYSFVACHQREHKNFPQRENF